MSELFYNNRDTASDNTSVLLFMNGGFAVNYIILRSV